MSEDTDISDLPTPGNADISDLPVPKTGDSGPRDPTDGMSGADKFLAGAGKGMVDTGRGVYQLGASIGHAAGMVSDEKMAQIQKDVDDAKERDAPLMDTTAGKVGNVVGQAAPMLLAPGAGILGSAAEGAALGAAQPVASDESRGQNAIRGAIGGAGGATAGKALGVVAGYGIPMARRAAVNILDREGIPTSVAQKTGAKAAQAVERGSAQISDAQKEFEATQKPAFNRAVLKRIGVNDPDVTAATPDVLGPAHARITGIMDDVSSRTKPELDDQLLNDMINVGHDASRQLPESHLGPIHENINDIITNAAKNGGHLDGTFVQKLNSNLGALSRNPDYAPVVGDLQEAVHNAVKRYATPGDAELMQGAQRQYRALKQITDSADAATGDISIPKLMTQVNSKSYGGRNATMYGKGDQSLIELARAAKTVIPDSLGNSGTSERMLGPLTAMEVARSGEPLKAAIKLGAGVVAGGAAGRAMRNQGLIGKSLATGVPGLRTVGRLGKDVAPAAGYAETESQPTDRAERKSGGKVDENALLERLIKRWKSAKKATDETTKPLLKVPDAAIVKALSVAQESI